MISAVWTVEDTLEERYAIKFCFKLGKNATETYGMLQTAYVSVASFPSLKQNFIAYRFSKVSDCIFEINQL